MDQNGLGNNRNTIPDIYAGANDKPKKKSAKEILDEDLKKAAEKKDKELLKTEKTKTLKDDLKVGMKYRANQLKSLSKFAFQKGKEKLYGQIDLLKKKID
jgi:hypothetical protein